MPDRQELKILHGPSNVASVASVLARAQRARGLNAHAVCHTPGRGVSPDFVLGQRGATGKPFAPFLLSDFPGYDVFHFYYDETYFGRSFGEINILQKLGKKVVLTFLGCEVRDSKAELRKTTPTICQDCWPEGCSRNRVQLLEAAGKADAVFVTTPDLLEYVPRARWLPLPVAQDLITPHVPRHRIWTHKDPLTVFHAPTDPQKKGSSYLEAAVGKLIRDGQPIRLVLAGDEPQEDIWRKAARCDVAVDQLLSGVYGTFGAEMMLAGVPLINRMEPAVWAELPAGIIHSDPDSIATVLMHILNGQIDLAAASARARAYAVCHEAETVTTLFDPIYESAPERAG
jgi:hypothetical protein